MAVDKLLIGVQAQYLGNLLGRSGPGQILLVGENEEGGPGQLLLRQQLLQLGPSQLQAMPIGAVDDPDQSVGPLEVVAPIRSDRLLAADVPKVELVSTQFERLYIETQCWLDGVDGLPGKLT